MVEFDSWLCYPIRRICLRKIFLENLIFSKYGIFKQKIKVSFMENDGKENTQETETSPEELGLKDIKLEEEVSPEELEDQELEKSEQDPEEKPDKQDYVGVSDQSFKYSKNITNLDDQKDNEKSFKDKALEVAKSLKNLCLKVLDIVTLGIFNFSDQIKEAEKPGVDAFSLMGSAATSAAETVAPSLRKLFSGVEESGFMKKSSNGETLEGEDNSLKDFVSKSDDASTVEIMSTDEKRDLAKQSGALDSIKNNDQRSDSSEQDGTSVELSNIPDVENKDTGR